MQALRAKDFVNSAGVNTHVGNAAIAAPYGNIALVSACVNYLGVQRLRDMPGGPLAGYEAVAGVTGAKYCMAISETAPASYAGDLAFNLSLAATGAVFALEGCNEPDGAYATSQGGSAHAAAAFQPTVYAAAQKQKLITVANSFANIWPDPGSYGTTGDLSAYADWANAHTYFQPHQCGPNGNGYFNLGMIQWVQKDAGLTTPNKPCAHTEFGWLHGTNSENAIASYVLTFFFSAHSQWSCPFSACYALFDDSAGAWGLFNNDGTPRPAAIAIRNVLMLLKDGADDALRFTPDLMLMTLANSPAGENVNAGGHAALYQKANGELWLVLWNDQRLTTEDGASPPDASISVPPAYVTINLPSSVGLIEVYDPLLSVTAQRSIANTGTFTIAVPARPVLCRLV
jgi:hypothetical protein